MIHDKSRLLEQIVAQLERELASVTRAAQSAHEAATHEESKAEDQYDTRGLEASYLAEAQAGRVTELKKLVVHFQHFPTRKFTETDPVEVGALVELEMGGKSQLYLLAALGGGLSLEIAGQRVQVLTPQAPLGDALLGRRLGEGVEVELQGSLREYKILSVG
ncbi:MAG: GreA/GreB family elongation factor [Bdellovibrionales bacterium]|nr:GreA/GreB family elongation factor [Bdellovibrionales bacterium]